MKCKYQDAQRKGVEMHKWLVSGSLVRTTGEQKYANGTNTNYLKVTIHPLVSLFILTADHFFSLGEPRK
jgi:hypothetical protein